MDLETVSLVSQIIGSVTIVGGAIFALIQFYEVRRQRHEQRAAEQRAPAYERVDWKP